MFLHCEFASNKGRFLKFKKLKDGPGLWWDTVTTVTIFEANFELGPRQTNESLYSLVGGQPSNGMKFLQQACIWDCSVECAY